MMNTEQITSTFIERYLSSRDTLEKRAPGLGYLRDEALNFLKEKPLPKYKSEAYQTFDISTLLSEEFQLTSELKTRPAPHPESSCNFHFDFSLISNRHIHTSEGAIHSPNLQEEEFFMGSLTDFQKIYASVAKEYLGQSVSAKQDPITALNTLFMEEVLVIYLPKGCKAKTPLHLTQHLAVYSPEVRCFSFPRILIIAEEESEAQLLFCARSDMDNVTAYRVSVIEVFAKKGSRLECYDIEETSALSTRVQNVHIHQEEESSVLYNTLTITNGRSRNNYFCSLSGEKATLNLDGVAILDGTQQVDTYSIIRHNAPNCTSNELFKYTVNDSARGAFSGLIYVDQKAQKTEAYQNNRNLLLSKQARMNAKPQLEIYADDVKCSHGMTTGELDSSALFYLQQRGIPADEARRMLIVAFVGDIIEKINIPLLRERLIELVEERFKNYSK